MCALPLTAGKADELRYVYQRIGFQCFTETRFEDAGYHLFEGNLDPCLLISYFPDLRGSMFSPDDEVEMFAGVADGMTPFDSVDDISTCRSFASSQSPCFSSVFPAPVLPTGAVPPRLISSLRRPSQELLSTSRPQHALCAADC